MNSQIVPELFSVVCDDNPEQFSEGIVIDIEELRMFWPTETDKSSDKVVDTNGKIDSTLAVCDPTSDTARPVTHIEIIKSSSRRVTGANRVVPLLTSALNSGKLATTNFGLADVYKSFLCDLGNTDSNRKCLICLKELLTCTELEYHVKEIHKLNSSPDQCFVCRKRYVFQEQLQDHLHHIHGIENPDLICKMCFMEFSTSMEQKAHERKHEQTYSCQMCKKKFSSEYLCQKHLNQHLIIQGNLRDCKKCGRRFKNIASLEIHEKRHSFVQCVVCEVSFNTDIEMLFHINNHKTDDVIKILSHVEQVDQDEKHLEVMLAAYSKVSKVKVSSDIKQSEKSSDETDIFDCLSDLISVVTQNNNASSEKKLGIECKLCGKSVMTNRELLEHRQHFHLRNRTCPFCGKRNRSVSQTWRHMKSHIQKNKPNSSKLSIDPSADNVEDATKSKPPRTNTRLFSCHICSRKFLYPGSRDNHVLQHSKDKGDSWKCAACGDVFSDPGLLLSHSSIHKSSIQCNICDKEFSSQSILQSHLKSHSCEEKKKKHKCSFCSVECPTLFGLQAHIRCHTGERPYTCGECQRKFKRLQAVKKHIQVVHNSASLEHHSCSDCSKVFNSSGNMVRHYLRIHCHVRRFICGICGSRFGQNQDMRRHFKAFHQLDMPNINGTDRKALKEIYVIPSIDNLPEDHPHAVKIKAIVAEEKAKFKGLSELMSKKSVQNEDAVVKSIVKFLQEFSSESDGIATSPCIESSRRSHEVTNNITPKNDESTSQNKNDLLSHHNVNEVQIVHPPDNDDSKGIICKICGKQYLGEVEYLKHVSVGNDSISCQQCGLSFCDDVLLDYHLSSEHEVTLSKININEIPEKENFSLQYKNVKDVQNFRNVIDVQSIFDQQIFPGDQNHSVIMSNGENLLTVVPDTVSVNSGQTDATTSGALSMNGILVQNIFIHQAPGILQTVPVAFQDQGIINSTNLTPVVTFNSLPLTTDEPTNSSLLGLNNNHDVTFLNGDNISTSMPKSIDNTINKISSLHEPSENNENVTNVMNRTLEYSTSTEFLHESEQSHPKETILQSSQNKPSKKKHEESKKPTCEFCNEQFFNASSLTRHMKCHRGAKRFECPHCGKYFTEKHNLKVHIMIHTGERPFVCEECGKQLRYRKDVMDHKRMHMGEKPFECDECGRRFIRQRELIRHKTIHTGEKKHKCPICGKAFARLDQLKLGHLPTHDVNSHTCNICNKTFKLKSKLKQHQILHSGVKEFQCDICKKRFALGTYLRTHMQSHRKKDTCLQCNICCRQFASDKTLQVHKQNCFSKPKKTHIKRVKSLDNSSEITQNLILQKGNEDLQSEGVADIEMQDVDLSLLDGDSCNAVIYLQMTPEDLKLTFSGADDKLFTS